LAALASSALAEGTAAEPLAVRADIPALKNQKTAVWTAPPRILSWKQMEERANWYASNDDSYLSAINNFDSGRLFRSRKEMLYRDTLRLLLTKRQVRVWLRDDLHLQCEFKRFHTVDDGRELGLKLGVYYRFD
jgi:hypothetical protein